MQLHECPTRKILQMQLMTSIVCFGLARVCLSVVCAVGSRCLATGQWGFEENPSSEIGHKVFRPTQKAVQNQFADAEDSRPAR